MKKMLIILPSIALVLVLGFFTAIYLVHSSITEVNIELARSYDGYTQPVSAHGIEIVKQEITCGYAVIEMLARWNGQSEVTEASLYEDNKQKIVTASGDGFLREAEKRIDGYHFQRYTNVRGIEMLDRMHGQLEKGYPVPIEFAAQDTNGEWTLHFALVTGMDGDTITVANPYGYEENYTLEAFLHAMRYDSYENMPLPLRMGFFFGLFTRNTFYTFAQ